MGFSGIHLNQLRTIFHIREALHQSPNAMKGKAHGTQRTRHNRLLGEFSTGLAHQYRATQPFAGAGIEAVISKTMD